MSIRVEKILHNVRTAMYKLHGEVTLLRVSLLESPDKDIYYGIYGKWVSATDYPAIPEALVAVSQGKGFEIEWI